MKIALLTVYISPRWAASLQLQVCLVCRHLKLLYASRLQQCASYGFAKQEHEFFFF
uniref:Uncharacterized protein n=1 Tax=Setaria viridis TaxID=4556 RepID=A0A4U6SR53_SETVI|nr:hypothetical protein SEVIR_9G080250v2 [Setaria viridis]